MLFSMTSEVNLQECPYCKDSFPIDRGNVDFTNLQKELPAGFEYLLCKLGEYSAGAGLSPEYEAMVRLKIKDEKTAKEWIEAYQKSSLTTWRTERTYPKAVNNVCKFEKKCHHNTRASTFMSDKKRSKNTLCPTLLKLKIRRTDWSRNRFSRSKDPHLPIWVCTVIISRRHNHSLDDPRSLSHRDVSSEVKEKISTMFENGFSPINAFNQHKLDLKEEHGEDYERIVNDRHYCPELQYYYRLYYRLNRKEDFQCKGKDLKEALREKTEEYNAENGNCIRMTIQGNDIIVAIVTPLMQRTNSVIRQAEQMVFLDSSGKLEHCNCYVFVMLVDVGIGGVPLGCLVTTSQSKEAIECGLSMIKEMLGNIAFFGRGSEGPGLFLTDNLEAEKQALHSVFPKSEQLLCSFHILQAFWQYLYSDVSKIPAEERLTLFDFMKQLIQASSQTELDLKYKEACAYLEDHVYEPVILYFQEIYKQRNVWAVCNANFVVQGDTEGNNFCDLAVWVLKDKFTSRIKASNMLQVVDFIISRMDQLYHHRLVDLAHGRVMKALQGRYMQSEVFCRKVAGFVLDKGLSVYNVPKDKNNMKEYYQLDMSVGLCSCPNGIKGLPCRHQMAVIKHHDSPKWKFQVVKCEEFKKLLLYIAEGDPVVEIDQFASRLKTMLSSKPTELKEPLMNFFNRMSTLSDEELLVAMKSCGKRNKAGEMSRQTGSKRKQSKDEQSQQPKRLKENKLRDKSRRRDKKERKNKIMRTVNSGMVNDEELDTAVFAMIDHGIDSVDAGVGSHPDQGSNGLRDQTKDSTNLGFTEAQGNQNDNNMVAVIEYQVVENGVDLSNTEDNKGPTVLSLVAS